MIGIFDSGVGGLTVVKQIQEHLPEYNIIYFGDTARVPYGNRSRDVIVKYSKEDTLLLLKKGADVIVVACHTASAQAARVLRQEHPDVLIFDVIKAALEKALDVSKNKKIGIIGTRGTVRSEVHENLIKKLDTEAEIFPIACPLFVPLVEEGYSGKPETKKIIKGYLRPLKEKRIDTIILACTHYPLLKKEISHFFRQKVNIIDPGKETAIKLKEEIENNKSLKTQLQKNNRASEFYVSDLTPNLEQTAKNILQKQMKFEHLDLETIKQKNA